MAKVCSYLILDGMDYPEGRAKNRRSDFNMLTSVRVIVDE